MEVSEQKKPRNLQCFVGFQFDVGNGVGAGDGSGVLKRPCVAWGVGDTDSVEAFCPSNERGSKLPS